MPEEQLEREAQAELEDEDEEAEEEEVRPRLEFERCSGRVYFSGMECPPNPKTQKKTIKHKDRNPKFHNPQILQERFDKAATFPSGAGRLWGWSSAFPGRVDFKVWFRVLRLVSGHLAWFPIVVYASKHSGGAPSSARGMSVAQGSLKLSDSFRCKTREEGRGGCTDRALLGLGLRMVRLVQLSMPFFFGQARQEIPDSPDDPVPLRDSDPDRRPSRRP